MKFIRGFLISLQFLTIIPIKSSLPMDKAHLEKSIQTFPFVGLVQGLFCSSLLYILIEWTPFSSLAIALIIWLSTFFITGGMHLDGWMDTSDAYFSYQEHSRKLEIMSDSNTGAFGVLSVLVLLSTRFLFIYEMTLLTNSLVFLLIILIPFLSKTVLGYVLIHTPAAKNEGLAFVLKEASSRHTFTIIGTYVIGMIGIVGLLDVRFILPVFLFVIVASVMAVFFRKKSQKWFGGITGDVLGAAVEGTENILWMTLWLLLYFVMG